MLVKLADLGHPLHEDKSLCKCHGHKNVSLAYRWRLGRAMVLGSLQCLGVLLFWVIVRQGLAALAAGAEWEGWLHFFLSSILSFFFFSLSPQIRLGLTTMLSTGPLSRLSNSKTNKQMNGGTNKQTVLQS